MPDIPPPFLHDWLLLPAISSKSDKTESKQTTLSHLIAATLSHNQEAFFFSFVSGEQQEPLLLSTLISSASAAADCEENEYKEKNFSSLHSLSAVLFFLGGLFVWPPPQSGKNGAD